MITPEEFSEGSVLLIDKPLQWSSFQAVNKIKWAILKHYKLKKIKIGHAGTLDPLASGLLVICTGKYTKKITEIQDAVKTYTGTITLGATTPSYDMETEVDFQYPTDHITPELIEEVRQHFIGELVQIPPVFSAIKKNGKRLYEFARDGKEIEVPQRTIYIHTFNLDITDFPHIHFEVQCSKGTYIRSLANDFGKALGSGAYLSALRRNQIGDYSVNEALTPDAFIEKHIPDLRKSERPIILTTIISPERKKKVTLNDSFADKRERLNNQFKQEKTINDLYEEREQKRRGEQTSESSFASLNIEAIFPKKKQQKKRGLRYEVEYFFRMFTHTDKAITLTLLILFGTVITLMAMQLQNMPKEIGIELALSPEDLPYDFSKKEQQETVETHSNDNVKLTTNVYNQADTRLQHDEDFKTLEEIMAERATEEMASAKEALVGNSKMATDLVITDNTLHKNTEKIVTTNKANKNTLVKYSLSGRTGYVPNPVFTCEKEGQVVVIITVDGAGKVIKTAIDKINTTTTDDCLLENSLLYANDAKFNAVNNKKEQIGSITYIFERKR